MGSGPWGFVCGAFSIVVLLRFKAQDVTVLQRAWDSTAGTVFKTQVCVVGCVWGWWVKCLLSKHKDLSVDPQHSYRKRSVVACACNHTTGEVGMASPRGSLSN